MPEVRLPGVLDPATGGRRRVRVQGTTLGAALADLCAQIPTLAVHLMDGGELRPHVVCIHQGITRRRLDHPVGADDEIAILQAVSGG